MTKKLPSNMQMTSTETIPNIVRSRIDIQVTETTTSRAQDHDLNNVPFGKVYADHMFVAEYKNGKWQDFSIQPYDKISFVPAISALHYGQSIFEGMKAYKKQDGKSVLFRPLENWKRLNLSAKRMAMAEIPEDVFMGGLELLLKIDKNWIPDDPGTALYIRPFMFANEEYIGIKPADNFKFIIFTCPAGSYYTTPVKVLVSDNYVRAFKGGTGFAKAAGNYGATMLPLVEAKEQGFDQMLWLNGEDFETIQEIGTMNVAFVIDGKVVTPKTDYGDILKGITRDSTLTVLRDKGFTVEERDITISEVVAAHENGTLEDAFGMGTAATIAHIATLGYKGKVMELPAIENREISNLVKLAMNNIKTGIEPDTHNWLLPV